MYIVQMKGNAFYMEIIFMLNFKFNLLKRYLNCFKNILGYIFLVNILLLCDLYFISMTDIRCKENVFFSTKTDYNTSCVYIYCFIM